MIWRLFIILIASAVVTMTGCKKKEPAPKPTEVKVTEENLDSELDKLEAEIEADIAAEE